MAAGAVSPGEEPGAGALLAEAGRRLAGTLNLRRCLRTVAEIAVTHLADVAVVVRPPVLGSATVVRLARSGRAEERTVPQEEVAAVPELAEALTAYPPGPCRRPAPGAALDRVTGDPGAGEVLSCSLPGNAAPAGALLLLRRSGRAGFDDRAEALARTFAAIAGATLAAAELYRIQVDAMAVLQADLRLPPLPQIAGVELGASHQPGDEGVQLGGDFYDVYPSPAPERHPVVVVLGDVAGKGAQAAGLAGRVRQTLRTLHLLGHDPVAMLHILNRVLLQPGQSDRFVTLVTAALRPESGGVRLTVATGGHPAPLVLRRDGAVHRLPATGTLVGAVRQLAVSPADVLLAPGELCLLYSDGMLEGRNAGSGPRYGDQRLREALGTCQGMPAGVAVERLRQLVAEWVHGRVPDDLAMLAIRAPAAGGQATTGEVRPTGPAEDGR